MIKKIIIFSFLILLISSCGDSKWEAKDPNDVETQNSGKMSYALDESISHLLDEPLKMYDEYYDKIIVSSEKLNSRKVMAKLLAGEVRAAVLARDYLHDEDSLMKEFELPEHLRFKAAIDALSIVVNKDFPLDTINASQVLEILSNNKKLKDFYPGIDQTYEYYSRDRYSSEWANIKSTMNDNGNVSKPFTRINDNDSLIKIAEEGKGIVFTYFSNVVKNEKVKSLRIGYSDSTGKYISPKPVHQGWIVQGLYPYPVNYWVYLLDRQQNIAFWFANYIAKEEDVQRYFLKQGIVPAFAKIRLRPQ